MCVNCETMKLCERLEKQIKNLEAGGSINPDALATIIREAHNRLAGYANASAVSIALLRGDIETAALIVNGPAVDPGSHSGGIH